MTDKFKDFAARSLAVASRAYAARMKRAGRGSFAIAVAALTRDEAKIIYTGPLPSALRRYAPIASRIAPRD